MKDGLSRLLTSRQSQRWPWVVVATIGLAGTVVSGVWLWRHVLREWLTDFFNLGLPERDQLASVVSMFLGAAGLLVSVAALLVARAQLRQGRHGKTTEPAAGHIDRDQAAVDRLRVHLGRRTALPRMGDSASRGLALRVHPAIPLPEPATGLTASPPRDEIRDSPSPRWRRLLRLPWRGKGSAVGGLDPDLPLFIDRDQGPKVAAWMRAAATSGGFLLLIGDSSVGKTRLLYESARHELADFAVLAPDRGDGELVNSLAQASVPLPKLIVWLDELHRFLDGPYLPSGGTPITASTIGRLLETPTPVVILSAMWPETAAQLRGSDPDSATGQARPRYLGAVDVLAHPGCHQLALTTFSAAERTTVARLASRDPRLVEALADRQFNVTETLAGAPQLMRRYQQATPEQQAILDAAIDARRLGIQAPLTSDLLRQAARGYLPRVPDDTWFPPVLDDLVRFERATAPLLEIANADHTAVLGYTVADYLLQHASAERRTRRIPAAAWQAFIAHIHDLEDVYLLADGADRRLLYCYAEPLYRRVADADDPGYAAVATRWLAELLAKQGRVEDLRARADAYDEDAAWRLAELLVKQGRVEELRARADAGEWEAALELAGLLAVQGRVEELRARADAGDEVAAGRLGELLADEGLVEEAIAVLGAAADAGDPWAPKRLAELLAEQGRVEELRARADAGDRDAASGLAGLLAEQGQMEELRGRADAGDRVAASHLSDVLAEQGQVEEAIALLGPDNADWEAALLENMLLAKGGRVEELGARADAGDRDAASGLAGLLAEQGRVDDLRGRADAGDREAAMSLAELLAEQGRVEEAIAVLRPVADAGDRKAAMSLAELLAEQGRVEEAIAVLRRAVDAGDRKAPKRLAELLAEQGRVEEAIAVLRRAVDAGSWDAEGHLADFLAEQGRVEELHTEIDAGNHKAADRLIELLAEQGDGEQADRIRRFGLNPDGSIADDPASRMDAEGGTA